MITRFEKGLFWVLTPEDVDERRLRDCLSLTEDDLFEVQEAMKRIREQDRASQ
jgi:hypothetical protein